MKHPFHSLIAATAVATIIATAGVATAAVDPGDLACHTTVAKAISKYQSTVAKNLIGCHKGRTGGKLLLSTNCNNGLYDPKLKRTGARQKAIDAIVDKCSAATVALFPGGQYGACPGSTVGTIDNATELANCQLDMAETFVAMMVASAVGNPNTLPQGIDAKGIAKCQGTIGKGLGKILKTAAKERSACQKAAESLPAGTTDYDACSGPTGDPSSKIAAAITAAKLAIDASCAFGPESLSQINNCGSTPTEMKSCAIDEAVVGLTNGLIAGMYELPDETCPVSARITINGAYGALTGKTTNSRLDSGYTGAAHNVDVVDGSLGGVLIQNCDPGCLNCDVRIDATQHYCRCENDSTIECNEVPTGAGPQTSPECGGNLCQCMFGPPLPLSSGGTPVCAVNRFATEFTGGTTTVGSYDVGTRTNTQVFTGHHLLRPCPTCVGDPTPNDGLKQGQCKYEEEDPAVGACDVNAIGADSFGSTSFDCMPDIGKDIGTLNLALRFTDGSVSFTGAIGGANCAAGTCHCSHCSGNSSVGCASNAECAAVGAGTCGVNLGGDNPRQNSCTAGVADCVVNPKDPSMGICTGGPFDKFCEGALRASGGGIIPCSSDAACDVSDSICDGGDCGLCVSGMPGSQRSCFLPTISSMGTPGLFGSDGVSAFCSARTASPTVNSAGGLPGPGRVRLDFDFDIKCPDNSTSFGFPAGANCP